MPDIPGNRQQFKPTVTQSSDHVTPHKNRWLSVAGIKVN
jgi:hypothetical protein